MLGIENSNFGVGFGDIFSESVEVSQVSMRKPRIEDFLNRFESLLSFDISMNGSGILEWHRDTQEIKHYCITVDSDVDLSADSLAEEKMRLGYAEDVLTLFGGKHYETVVIEDVFGGRNYDTTRKLLALNSIVGTLILQNKLSADNFYKRNNKLWKKYLATVYKVKGLKDKLNIEEALYYMEYPLAVRYRNATKKEKDAISYQDLLDSTGLGVGLSIELSLKDKRKSSSKKLTMKDIVVDYVMDMIDIDYLDDRALEDAQFEEVTLDIDIEKKILMQAQEGYDNEETTVYVMKVENEKLGTFGLSHNIPFSDQGYVYVMFYDKKLKQRLKKR